MTVSVVHVQTSTEACQTIECNLSIRFCVILCRRLGSRNDLSSVKTRIRPSRASIVNTSFCLKAVKFSICFSSGCCVNPFPPGFLSQSDESVHNDFLFLFLIHCLCACRYSQGIGASRSLLPTSLSEHLLVGQVGNPPTLGTTLCVSRARMPPNRLGCLHGLAHAAGHEHC